MSQTNDQLPSFPVGYHRFNRNQLFNYQLNRWYSFGFIRPEDVEPAAKKIRTFEYWKRVMLAAAQKAIWQNRTMNAAFYYRAAEFYTMDGDDPDKEYYYDTFRDLFYRAVAGDAPERIRVPYGSVSLPVLRFAPAGRPRGTVLLHGGFDSFIEEFYYIMKYLARVGYDVVGFEGPGQGNVLIKQHGGLDYRWERPVGAVLDHLGIDRASLFGISMGGWFALRAAAFEPRIQNVIATGHAIDYGRIPPAFAQWLMSFFAGHFRGYTARSFARAMKRRGMRGWQIANLVHITKIASPLEAFEYIMGLNEQNLHSERVTQRVLYLTGRNDHFIPFKMHDMQVRALSNAASLTDRVFTKAEHADNHCQVGNIGLMLDVVIDWLNNT